MRWLLAWWPSTLSAHRARLLTAVAMLECVLVSEVVCLQVCDLWFDHLMSYGVPGFEGTWSVHIDRLKNAIQRKRHYPAFGWSRDEFGPFMSTLTHFEFIANFATISFVLAVICLSFPLTVVFMRISRARLDRATWHSAFLQVCPKY